MPFRLALDGMGADSSPLPELLGAKRATEADPGLEVSVIGDKATLNRSADEVGLLPARVTLVHASERVTMSDRPADAIRNKKHSSIAVGLRLCAEGRADGFISAGNTGAVMGQALFTLKRIEGIQRPAIGVLLPTHTGHCLLLDAGANAQNRPEHILQFAVMGSVFYRDVFGVESPKVGLVSIGEEESKGNSDVFAAHKLLLHSPLNYEGFIEGHTISSGHADVVVTDGFTGNVILKLAEGAVEFAIEVIREEIGKGGAAAKLGALLLRSAFGRVRHRLDFETYGGAPLLGVKGNVIICHGRSGPKAVVNAITVAKHLWESNAVEEIRRGVEGLS